MVNSYGWFRKRMTATFKMNWSGPHILIVEQRK